MGERLRRGSALPWLLGAFLALGVVYGWATPIFEASDELWHYGMVEAIAESGQLPVQQPGIETPWEQEGSQPPLYYLLAAALVAPIERGDAEALRQPNPHVKAGVPGAPDNKNLVLHDDLHPPPQGTALAVYLLRALGIGLGMVTVSAVHASARLLAPRKGGTGTRPGVALLAAGLTAFNPMFLFISASVNNDNLVTALNSAIIWQTLLMLRDGLSWRRSALLAVLLALASLSKLSGLVLVPVVALGGLWVALRKDGRQGRDWRGLVTLGGLMIGAWLLLAGWWYARNLTLYGELFGTQTMAAVAGPREEPFTLGTLLAEFEGFRISYWGLFGAVNVLAAPAFYVIMDAVTALALGGLAAHLWRRRAEGGALFPVLLLGLTVMLGMGGVIAWTAQTYASQGRLLFPYMAAISPLLAVGLAEARFPARVTVPVAGLWALVVPFAYIAPAYAPPPPLEALPDEASPVYARFEEVALVGYRAEMARYEPGEAVPITLYWQVTAQSAQDLSLYLHAVDEAGNVIGKVDTYPGGGRLRTTTWQPGAIYADRYAVPLDAEASGRSRLRISVGWWHRPTETVMRPTDAEGTPLESVMLEVGGFAGAAEEPLPADLVETERAGFGGVIALLGYQWAGDRLRLAWEATGTPADDYTVFVQVLDEENRIVGQGDAPPALPTRYWRAGERHVTEHPIVYPLPPAAGSYRVVIGWYRPGDFARLETAQPDNAYLLTTIRLP